MLLRLTGFTTMSALFRIFGGGSRCECRIEVPFEPEAAAVRYAPTYLKLTKRRQVYCGVIDAAGEERFRLSWEQQRILGRSQR